MPLWCGWAATSLAALSCTIATSFAQVLCCARTPNEPNAVRRAS
jgi:hypothetical protein